MGLRGKHTIIKTIGFVSIYIFIFVFLLYFLYKQYFNVYKDNFHTNTLSTDNLRNMEKKHYRAVMLVLASHNNTTFENCRNVWKSYMKLDNQIKVYFVYGNSGLELTDIDNDSDLIFENVHESYPVLIEKTIEAMKIIDENISYDYFIRTNLSTFWDFQKLHLHLNDLPKTNCYSGDGPLPGYTPDGYYLSGTDTIVSKEMINEIINNTDKVDYNTIEDQAMGKFFNGVLGAPMLPNRICFFEDITSIDEIDKINDRITNAIINNVDHYRVKTQSNNRDEIDMFIYKQLLLRIYNINL